MPRSAHVVRPTPGPGKAQHASPSGPPADSRAAKDAAPETAAPGEDTAKNPEETAAPNTKTGAKPSARARPKSAQSSKTKSVPAARKSAEPRKGGAAAPEPPQLLAPPESAVRHDLDELPREKAEPTEDAPEKPVAALPPWMEAPPLPDEPEAPDLPAGVEPPDPIAEEDSARRRLAELLAQVQATTKRDRSTGEPEQTDSSTPPEQGAPSAAAPEQGAPATAAPEPSAPATAPPEPSVPVTTAGEASAPATTAAERSDQSLTAPHRRHRRAVAQRRPPLRLIALALLVPLVVAGVVLVIRSTDGGDTVAAPRALRTWVGANVAKSTPLLVPAAVVADLAENGHQRDRLVGYDNADVEWRCCPILVLSSGIPTDSPAIAEAVPQSRLIAEFTTSGDRWQIREIFLGDRATEQERVKNDQAARVDAGTKLAANPRLDLAPGARATLAGGFVDARLMIALVGITARHNVTVGAFPVPRGEESTGAPRRTARITAIDGRPPAAGDPGTQDVIAFLTSQVPPYRPDRTPIDDGGDPSLSITFHAPSPLGLIAPVP